MAATARLVRHVPVDRQGRVVIPAEFREQLGVETGDRVTMFIDDDGTLRLLTADQAIRQVQEEVAKYVPHGRSLVDELLAERRAEVEREEREARDAAKERQRRRPRTQGE